MANRTEGATSRRKEAKRPRKGWSDQQSRLIYWFSSLFFKLLFRYWVIDYRVIGVEKIPIEGGLFLIANHTTAMDPFIVGYPVPRITRGPGKIELFENPLLAWYMKKLGIFPLKQDVADTTAVRTMVELYRHGKLVIVFPEGGRSPTGEMRPFFPDFARLMIRLKAPIVPAGIAGGRELLPIGTRIPRRRTPVIVIYGEPFDMSSYYSRELTPETIEEATAFIQCRVEELVMAARAERAQLLERRAGRLGGKDSAPRT